MSIDIDFLKRYATLDKTLQKATVETISNFPELYFAGQHLEKLTGARDEKLRTVRIVGQYRGIVLALPSGDYVLKDIVTHDKADESVRKTFTVNQVLGVMEDRDQAAIDTLQPVFAEQASATTQRLFDDVSDSTLTQLGIDPQLLPLVRLLVTDMHLDLLEKLIPALQHQVLTGLASGMSPEEVWAQVSSYVVDVPDEVDPTDFAAAIDRTPEKYATVTEPDELLEMLAKPFAVWRTYLHSQQQHLAHGSFRGPVQVTGGPGTGKTVVAVHRAAHLAERYRGQEGPPQILLTTFTRNLAVSLTAQVDLLITEPSLRSRIDVLSVDRLAYRVVSQDQGQRPEIIGSSALTAYFQLAANSTEGRLSAAFLQREWEQVVLAQGLLTREAYLDCERRGRGRLPRATSREEIWSLLAKVRTRLRERQVQTHEQVADQAARLLTGSGQPPYRHVIVDEGQDLHPTRWRLLRAAVAPGPDDMFLMADPNQRIYDSRVSLASLGIRVRGRSHRLTISYRTTQEILNWAVRILEPGSVEGLDDRTDSLAGYRSMTHGLRPVVQGYADRAAEHNGLAKQLAEWLAQGIEPSAIAVSARTGQLAEKARKALHRAGIPVTDAIAGTGDHVQIDTMHRMKGMEFRCVAVISVDVDQIPLPVAVTDADEDLMSHKQDLLRERCLLFVASTRARDELYVSHLAGRGSPFLPSGRG